MPSLVEIGAREDNETAAQKVFEPLSGVYFRMVSCGLHHLKCNECAWIDVQCVCPHAGGCYMQVGLMDVHWVRAFLRFCVFALRVRACVWKSACECACAHLQNPKSSP